MLEIDFEHDVNISSFVKEKTKRDEFWVLFDKAFNALYSSDNVDRREKVIGGVTSMFAAATKCNDLRHNVCGDFYEWLVQHFVKVLADDEMRCYHDEIISSFSSLLNCISSGNQILFNKAFGALLNIAENICSNIKGINTEKETMLHITEYNLTVPKGIGKWQFYIDVTEFSSWVSVIDCFIKVSKENFEGISRHSQSYHHRIILLVTGLVHSCDKNKQLILLKFVCSLIIQSSPAFSVLEWREIRNSFKILEDSDLDILHPDYKELFDSYFGLLSHLVNSQRRTCSKINSLFLESVLEILLLFIEKNNTDVKKWVTIARELISCVPVYFINNLDLKRFIDHLPSNEVLYLFFERYFFTLIEQYLNSGIDKTQRTVINIREVCEIWNHFLNLFIVFCEKYPNFKSEEIDLEVTSVLNILSMTRYIRTLQDKNNSLFLFFDKYNDHHIFITHLRKDVINPMRKKSLPLLIELAVSYIQVLLEKKYFSVEIYRLLLFPLTENMDQFIKATCLNGILNIIVFFQQNNCFPLHKVHNFLKEAIIRSKDYMDKATLIMYHCLFEGTSNNFLLKSFDCFLSSEVDKILKNAHLRNLMPCFLAGSCVLSRENCNWKIKCSYCDTIEDLQLPLWELNLNKYLNLYGFKFIKYLIKNETSIDQKRALLADLHRYLFHIQILKSRKMLCMLIEYLCALTFQMELPVGIFKILVYNQENNLEFENVKLIVNKILDFSFKNIKDKRDNWKKTLYKIVLEITQSFKCFTLSALQIYFILFTSSNIHTVYLQRKLVDLAKYHNTTLKQLLITHEVELSKMLVDLIIHNIQTDVCDAQSTVTYFSEVFEMMPIQFLEFRCTPYIITHILLNRSMNEIIFLLYQLSAIMKITVKDMFINNFVVIFSTIYFIEDDSLLSQSITILENFCECDVDTLIYLNYKDLICFILMNAHLPLKVLRFFHYHIKPDPNTRKSGVDTIADHIVGFLTFVDIKLLSPNSSSYIITSCLRAIPHLIKLLGEENVANISFKLLTTLRTGLPRHYNLYPKLSLKAWIYFLYCIDPSFLGPHLPTIVTVLTPLFQKFPTDVTNVFYYLIVKNGHLYHEYIPGLYFVQDSTIPKMHDVWCSIQSAIKSYEMIDIIQNTLKHVRNEGVDSRIHYLKFLYQQIRDNRYELLKIIHRGDRLTPVIRDIIECLMTNIQYGNIDVKLTCGNCLGEMGAINPARIGYDYNHCSKRKCYVVETEEFAYFVILELTNSLQKSDNSYALNIIASSIQELLKLYFPNKNERIEEFFKRFPSNERNILKSLLSTRYIFIEPVLIKRDVSKIGPINSKTTFEWACSWTSELITFIPSDCFCAKVFRICFPSIQLDFQALEALLPHILYHAIERCKVTDLLFIETEIKCILNLNGPDCYLPSRKNLLRGKVLPKHYNGVSNSDISEGRCVAIILDLIDYLYMARSTLEDGVVDSNNTSNMRLNGFLDRFSPLSLSLKSYILQDYCRSLFYFERGFSDSNHTDIAPLRYIYAKLNDSDGLLGVMRTSQSIPTVKENILSYVVCGNLQDAVSGYEKLSASLNTTECSRALIQAYLSINKPQIAKDLCYGVLQQSRYVLPTLCNEQAEVLLRSFLFEDLDDLLKKFNDDIKNNWCWGVDLTVIQTELFSWREQKMEEKIHSVRTHIVDHLSTISNTTLGAYRQGFNHILKLQELNELEKYAHLYKLLNQPDISTSDINKFFDSMDMDLTLDLLPAYGYHIQSALNRWQHILLAIKKFVKQLIPECDELLANQLGKIYLNAVQAARKSGNLQIANSYMALAEKFAPPGLFIENAKLHKAKLDTGTALLILIEGNKNLVSNNTVNTFGLKSRILCAQAKNLIARYNEESMNVDFNEVYENYIDAANTFPSEKNYFCLAQYLYKVHMAETLPDSKSGKRENQVNAALYFGLSLKYGCKYIYKSMFCMISLWLDFGMRLNEQREVMKSAPKDSLKSMENTMDQFNEVMGKNFSMLPKYVFMAVFSQLISRISHPEHKGKVLLHKMVSNLAITFPQQAFWMMTSFLKMSDADHKKCKEDLIKLIKTEKPDLLPFHASFIELIDVIINICNKKVPLDKLYLPLKSISQKIKLIITKHTIMIPSQIFRTICLPNSKHFNSGIGVMTHNAFPLDMVYFADVEDKVQVLPSLQRPKKLTFIGSNGLQYPFMCKPMDDLHLDARMMEFSSVINMYLKRDPDSCDRNLHIRTYSVVPITHECGLIEWLPDLCGYRTILMVKYKKRGYTLSHNEIKRKIEECKTLESKMDLFKNVLLPAHPPVLDKWFFLHFSSPDSWYVARQSFIRTAAVMSVIGYAMGLGDRHGENILIDTTNGDIVHVDFNCLFNKAQSFTCPEKVPFRLTQNLIKAMGSTGLEGHFVKSCEIANRVMRSNSDQLMCVLKPFLYDPILQKKKSEREKTMHEINVVQKKLAGAVITPNMKTNALSVEGQIRLLVAEATDVRNLSQMFHGWAAYL